MSAPARTYYLRSFGCQMNDHDAERLRGMLEARGFGRVDAPEAARVIVYNTCTVRRSADERFYGHLGAAARLKREDPERLVVVCGCLAQAEGEAFLDEHPFVDVALGPQSLHHLAEVLDDGLRGRGWFDDDGSFSGDMASCRERPFQAWVQVMSGCDNACSYCIVPRVRGRARSRPLESVVAEAGRLAADGVREITLLGQNVNAYGGDRESPGAPTFAALLTAIDAVDGIDRLRFTTSHPKDLGDDLIAAMASLASVCEQLHLPAQSGSNGVLEAMGRGYTMQRYVERIAALREAVPDVAVSTDLMVGFPGETDDDFQATIDLVEGVGFDAAFTFVFSPRPGTVAATLPGQVPADVARERIERLVDVTQQSALRRRREAVGRTAEILVEGPGRDGAGSRGRTRQNVTVNIAEAAAAGTLVAVDITAATSTTLRGRLAT